MYECKYCGFKCRWSFDMINSHLLSYHSTEFTEDLVKAGILKEVEEEL